MDATSRPPHLRGRFLFLDGLRGVAALAVALGHFIHPHESSIRPELVALFPRALVWLLDQAYLGVEIFFVLSGFVIAHSLWGQRITPRYAGNFALRRSLRLDPPYWLVLASVILVPYLVFPRFVDGLYASVGGTSGMIVNALYLPDVIWWRDLLAWVADRLPNPAWWRDHLPLTWHPRIVGVAWTLCLEVQFYLAYLALLAIAQFARRRIIRRRIADGVVALLFGSLAVFSIVRWCTHPNGTVDDFGGRWHMFFAGALLYATVAGAVGPWPMRGLIAGLFAFGATRGDPHALAIAATTAAIWLAARTGGLSTWLAWRPVQWLGHRSYSFYLVHLPVGATAMRIVHNATDGSAANALTAFGFALLTSFLAADLLYRLVENPAVRLSARLRPKAEAATRGVTPQTLATGHTDGPAFQPGPVVEKPAVNG